MTARRSRPKTSSGRWSARAIRRRRQSRSSSSGSTIGNFKIDGNRITADVKQFEPTLFKWMAFLTGYVLPKAYYEKVGAEGFEKKPIGSGPYMVDEFERNAFLRLKANPEYWGAKPAFETVIFKFVPDATSRVAEIESGSSDVTLEIPYEEFDRLKAKPGPRRRGDADLRHRHDLHHQHRADARQERAPRRDHADRQEGDRRPAAARLWRCRSTRWKRREYAAFDPVDQGRLRSGAGEEAARHSRLLAGEAGQVHDPDDARLQAEGLRDDPGDRRHVAQGRHRRQHRGLRDRQALRAARRAQARAGGVLQLGQRDRRSDRPRPASRCSARRRIRPGRPTTSTP